MISKKEHDAALRRVLRRLALILCGIFMMASGFYAVMGLGRGGVLLTIASAACLGYALGGSDENDDAI